MLVDFKESAKFSWLRSSSCEISWKKPPAGIFKINTDVATADDGRQSSIGVIIKDCRGVTVAALCCVLPGSFTMEETEALAIEAGIILAKELDLHQIIIESNSLSVVNSIRSKDSSGGFGHIVNGILSSLDEFSSWQIRHLKRDFNKVAHELARFARNDNVN